MKMSKFKVGDYVELIRTDMYKEFQGKQIISYVYSDGSVAIENIPKLIWLSLWWKPWAEEKEKDAQINDLGKHYRFSYKGINLDPFRIADIYGLDFPQSTILKKVLCTGNRGHKDTIQDYKDIICAAQRAIEMVIEDNETISNT